MVLAATTYVVSYRHWKLLCRINPFLGSDRETNNETTFAVRQHILISKNRQSLLGNGLINMFPRKWIRVQQYRHCCKRGFLRWFVPRVYKGDRWGNQVSSVRESEEKRNLEGSRRPERLLEPGSRRLVIIRRRYQATTSEDSVCWRTA
jgi:hypothetical protein